MHIAAAYDVQERFMRPAPFLRHYYAGYAGSNNTTARPAHISAAGDQGGLGRCIPHWPYRQVHVGHIQAMQQCKHAPG